MAGLCFEVDTEHVSSLVCSKEIIIDPVNPSWDALHRASLASENSRLHKFPVSQQQRFLTPPHTGPAHQLKPDWHEHILVFVDQGQDQNFSQAPLRPAVERSSGHLSCFYPL